MSEPLSPLGRALKLTHHSDGTSRMVIDNGTDKVMTVVCFSEMLPDLLTLGPVAVRNHMLTPSAQRLRRKRK